MHQGIIMQFKTIIKTSAAGVLLALSNASYASGFSPESRVEEVLNSVDTCTEESTGGCMDARIKTCIETSNGLAQEIQRVTSLRCTVKDLRTSEDIYLDGLEHFTFITSIDLKYDGGAGPEALHIEAISQLTGLKKLHFRYFTIADTKPLVELAKTQSSSTSCLDSLSITWSDIATTGSLNDISFLSEFDCLKNLTLYRNNISDISPIANLKKLEHLQLSHNYIQDLSPLRNISTLKVLNIHHNHPAPNDISPLTPSLFSELDDPSGQGKQGFTMILSADYSAFSCSSGDEKSGVKNLKLGCWDFDNDGIADHEDNCSAFAPNISLENWLVDAGYVDNDEETDLEFFKRHLADINIESYANPGQWDRDKDGLGNECDDDIDGDTFTNAEEELAGTLAWDASSFPPTDPNDLDSDGWLNGEDNCPNHANDGQWDLDQDGLGNECDDDIDGDGFTNEIELAEGTKPWDATSQPSLDKNDLDNDGLLNEADNCPNFPNPEQWDKDQDNIGNECDDDIDGDGFTNEAEAAAGTKAWDKSSFPIN